MEEWVEEVLFRGRPPSGPGSELPARLHVVFGRQAPDPLNDGQLVRQLSDPMSMASAAALHGYTAQDLVTEINGQLADDNATLVAQIAARDATIEHLSVEKFDLESANAQLAADKAGLVAALAALQTPPAQG